MENARNAATAASHERTNALENIVLLDRSSILVHVTGEDPVYVVGVYADIRGLPVSSETKRIAKAEIALRIQVPKQLRGNPDTLTYSHRKADNA